MHASPDRSERPSAPAGRPAGRRRSALGALLRGAALALALGGACAPSVARAAEDAAQAASKQFAAAQSLFDAKDYAGALPLFRKALGATGSPNARLYVARCLRELGRLPEAYDELRITQHEAAARAETEAKYAPTRDAAASEGAILERRVGRLVIAIADPEPGVEVTLDGAPVANERVGAPIAVTPGLREVVVTGPDGATARREVTVGAGEVKTLAVALPRPGEGGAAPPIAPPPEEPTSGGKLRVAGYVVTGLGVAGLGLFGVTAFLAESKFSTLEEECGAARCSDPKYGDVVDSGKTFDTLATVGLISGIAGVAVGTALIVFGGPSKTEGEGGSAAARGRGPTAAAGISVSPGGAAVRGVITF